MPIPTDDDSVEDRSIDDDTEDQDVDGSPEEEDDPGYESDDQGDGGGGGRGRGYGGGATAGGYAGIDYPQDVGTGIADNDYINLLRDITDVNLRKQLDHYLKHNPLTPAAVHKLKIYVRGVLNMGLVASNVRNSNDFERLMDRYLITKVELPLGLTCYDVNETFTHVINIVDLNYFNQELRAIGGFHMKRIATQTSESISQDQTQMQRGVEDKSTLQKLTSFLR